MDRLKSPFSARLAEPSHLQLPAQLRFDWIPFAAASVSALNPSLAVALAFQPGSPGRSRQERSWWTAGVLGDVHHDRAGEKGNGSRVDTPVKTSVSTWPGW